MSFTIVIPSRFGSSRLPGKPLLDIAGKPMIQRVWEQACGSAAQRIIIATDDKRIFDVATAFGAQVCMTSTAHLSGTDRLQEVVSEQGFDSGEIVVNVQGDEPLIPTAVINQVASNLESSSAAGIATLCEPIATVDELLNPNVVKVVSNNNGMALYFSRAAIPWPREHKLSSGETLPPSYNWFRHIGIYAYRVEFLHQFVKWAPAPLEQLEHLEQLRAMYYGVGIHVEKSVEAVPGGVDTQQDLDGVRASFAGESVS